MDVVLVCRDVGRPPLPLVLEYIPLDELEAVDPSMGVMCVQSRMLLLRTGSAFSSISTRSFRPEGAISKLLVFW